MIIDFFKTSLYRKLILAFIVVGFFPYLIFFINSIYFSEQKIINKLIDDHHLEAQKIVEDIDSHLSILQKEIRFISSLEVMDDIVAQDLDKRISRVLIQKNDDINLDIELFVIDKNAQIISSSNKNSISKEFEFKEKLESSKEYFFEKNHLFIFSKVLASFDQTKELGFLILKYNLHNLERFFIKEDGIYHQIYNPKNEFSIGKKLPFKSDLSLKNQIDENYLVINQKMLNMMSDFFIIYGENKDLALEFLHDFIFFMIIMIPVALFVTIFIAHYNTKKILKPITNLTQTTEMITKTKNFNILVEADGSKDEIARLSNAFNEMIATTYNALSALEEENRLRLKRFITLIEIFNKIIQTKNEDECIENSLSEFEYLSDTKLIFKKNLKENSEFLHIYLNDFEKNEKSYFGSIELDIDKFEDENEKKFYLSIATMITLQLERIRLIERTMSASRAKSAFISNMSHELRTPLNAIIGFTQYLIAYEELSDEVQDMISNIETSAHYLLSMINEILDIAKIEAGKMEAHFEMVNVKSLLDEVQMMSSALAIDKNLLFVVDHSELTVDVINCDPKLFKQIMLNLISNAIKFTQEGSIKVVVKNSLDEIIISVKDSGIGISKENLERLFNDFTQVENVMQKSQKGTGLGLSLSRKLSHLLHGDLELRSDGEGYGSEAIFTLTIS